MTRELISCWTSAGLPRYPLENPLLDGAFLIETWPGPSAVLHLGLGGNAAASEVIQRVFGARRPHS